MSNKSHKTEIPIEALEITRSEGYCLHFTGGYLKHRGLWNGVPVDRTSLNGKCMNVGELLGVSRRLSEYSTLLIFHRVAFIKQEQGNYRLLSGTSPERLT
jgi:hypothetical protein